MDEDLELMRIRLGCLEIASSNATRAALQDPKKLLDMAESYAAFVTQEPPHAE